MFEVVGSEVVGGRLAVRDVVHVVVRKWVAASGKVCVELGRHDVFVGIGLTPSPSSTKRLGSWTSCVGPPRRR